MTLFFSPISTDNMFYRKTEQCRACYVIERYATAMSSALRRSA